MTEFETVIGLEVHAQLRTGRKLFCRCATSFGAPPNTQICPVCLGLPGALPVVDPAAVDLAIAAGLALDCEVRARSVFARKSYFYPDLAKGYQITQFERPLLERGHLQIGDQRTRILRIHMEEDAAKSGHSSAGTVVDFNRAGVALIEIVSEPDLRSAEDAEAYLRALREILLHVGACDGNLEEGSFRCDANVSVRPAGDPVLGTRVELKNINSFRFVRLAIDNEAARQRAIVSSGGTVVQQTRSWDEAKQSTFLMRTKEEAEDYRYFPDPDLPTLVVSQGRIRAIESTLPERPAARRLRWQATYGVLPEQSEPLGAHPQVANYVDEVVSKVLESTEDNHADAGRRVLLFLLGEVLRHIPLDGVHARFAVDAERLSELLVLVERGTIHVGVAKDVFQRLLETDARPADIVEAEGLAQLTDANAIADVVAKIVADHPAQLAQYRAGKTKVFGFFVGQVMKATRGRANPAQVQAAVRAALDS